MMKKILIICGILFLSGCETDASKRPQNSPQEPVTFYGQTIKKTKDLSKDISAKDEEVKKQSDQLVD